MARRKLLSVALMALTLQSGLALAGEVGKAERLIVKRQYQAAVRLLEARAATGDAVARFRLAGLYRAGLGVVPDKPSALKLIEALAGEDYQPARLALSRFALRSEPRTVLAAPPYRATVLDRQPSINLRGQDQSGNSWLAVAAARDLLSLVAWEKKLKSIDVRTVNGDTALAAAVRNNQPVAVAGLIHGGVRVDLPGAHGALPLAVAAAHASPAIIRELLQAGAKPEGALDQASSRCRGDTARLLLQGSAEPRTGLNSLTPLHIVAQRCPDSSIVAVLTAAQTVEAKDRMARTPLWYASAAGNVPATGLLLSEGAQMDAADRDGLTALHAAARFSQAATIRVLIDAGADRQARDAHGNSPLMLASAAGCTACVKMLTAAPSAIDAVNQYGDTALILAVRSGSQDAVRALLLAGADPFIRNARRETALAIAERIGAPGLTEMVTP